ncbi:SnRK1-interacting protein 1 [Musa troglodytarum]|uniref:SnRK1-interacting protein 1 n=2 Tax=Musa troglodytarum TaxID=320322 RepID=A0A9E7F5C3_9LILI|nr:SnRK1-interacting protein 1 [Musa troglodytarum]
MPVSSLTSASPSLIPFLHVELVQLRNRVLLVMRSLEIRGSQMQLLLIALGLALAGTNFFSLEHHCNQVFELRKPAVWNFLRHSKALLMTVKFCGSYLEFKLTVVCAGIRKKSVLLSAAEQCTRILGNRQLPLQTHRQEKIQDSVAVVCVEKFGREAMAVRQVSVEIPKEFFRVQERNWGGLIALRELHSLNISSHLHVLQACHLRLKQARRSSRSTGPLYGRIGPSQDGPSHHCGHEAEVSYSEPKPFRPDTSGRLVMASFARNRFLLSRSYAAVAAKSKLAKQSPPFESAPAAAMVKEGEEVPAPVIGRPLSDILRELNKKVPESLIRTRTEDGFTIRYIPWFALFPSSVTYLMQLF